jgi:NTE family protein
MLDTQGARPAFAADGRPFERIALLLQGGGALGAYQGGVYQALAEASLHPHRVAGLSIGAVNAALIAGNPPEKRVERLREFWETVTAPPFGIPIPDAPVADGPARRLVNQMRTYSIMAFGAPHFFSPRVPPALWGDGKVDEISYYDARPLKETLERLVDFDRINDGSIHFSVNAVNVRSGQFVCFDNTTHRIGPEHVLASGSLPPYLAATEIDGEYYWDGALVSNTPLLCVLDADKHQDTLAFEVDLWNPEGELPHNLAEVDVRQTEIQLSSRNRAATAHYKHAQRLRAAMASLLKDLPEDLRSRPDAQLLAAAADDKVSNIVHLTYHARSYEGTTKYNDYSRPTMEEHWRSGYDDAVRAVGHPDLMQRPGKLDGYRTIELTKAGQA